MNCFLLSVSLIMCIDPKAGVKEVECTPISDELLCTDMSLDVACYQDTLRDLMLEGISTEKEMVKQLNVECRD